MASSESLKLRAARPKGEGILAAETMIDLDQQIPLEYLLDQDMADTEARLSWRKNLQNRPLGLAGLLDARGQVDVRSIIPVLHDAETRKKYGDKGPSFRAYLVGQQTPTYEQVVDSSSPEVREYIAPGIPPERVQGAQKPIVIMPNYLPLTGVDLDRPFDPENTKILDRATVGQTIHTDSRWDAEEAYDAYTSSVNTPAHEGIHRLFRNEKGILSPEDQQIIFSQIPFTSNDFNALAEATRMNIEHMFLGGVRYVLAPEALKNDPRFKRKVDRDIASEYNSIVRSARDNAESKNFIDDPDMRSYFHFKKDSDLVDRPKDKYYELVKDRYNKMVDILPSPKYAQPSDPEEEKSWWRRLLGKNKGGYVMTGAETMMGLD